MSSYLVGPKGEDVRIPSEVDSDGQPTDKAVWRTLHPPPGSTFSFYPSERGADLYKAALMDEHADQLTARTEA